MFAASKTAAVSGGYQIQRSLRFNSPDSAYLNRTLTTPTDNKKFTFSFWLKRSSITAWRTALSVSGSAYIEFTAVNDQLDFNNAGGRAITTAVFRDVSAWYHFVCVLDTANATANDRMIIYVNNVRQALTTNSPPTQNATGGLNSAAATYLGALNGSSEFYDGYMTEVNFIDGQALTPSSFGETNAQTGVWQPKAYSGSYGTNGFYLNFSDNSNTTAATLGKDYSGNGNNWTPNNFSVTAGIGNDSLTDTPTNNFSTLNPLQISTTYATISNGNLQYLDTTSAGSFQSGYSTVFASSGKYYFEATVTTGTGTPYPSVGSTSPPPSNDCYIEKTLTGYQGYGYYADGTKATNDTYTAFGASYTAGDTVSVAVDIDAGKVWFAKNGTWQASGDPAAGTNPAFNIVTGRPYGFAVGNGSSTNATQIDANFGQRAFLYSAPSGFSSLCTNNLATPTIGATTATQAGKYFNTILWTGNSSNPRAITGVGFQPDFSWLDRRDVGYGFWLYDAVRGAAKPLNSQSTAAEGSYQQLNSFDTDGFTQAGTVDQGNNISGGSYVAWNWKANGSGSSNTSGTITSTVSANTTSGFSVVTYTANGTSGTIGHGLGVAPSMIITKTRSATTDWGVYHTSLGNTGGLFLNLTNAFYSSSAFWNNTSPTSSVFSVGGGNAVNSPSGATYVAYCFAEVAGYSKFGSYTGNGSSDGVFVYCGFRPAFFLAKNITDGGNWNLYDNTRGPYNLDTPFVVPNSSAAEYTGGIDLVANGVKIRTDDSPAGSNINQSGKTYIFAAFASTPFKYSLAR